MKSIISYNVNGIRAASRKGFFDWLFAESPDILCIQETKATPEVLDSTILNPNGYLTYWHSAEKKGYSSVAIFSKEKPKHVEYGCGIEKYDREGRIIRADYDDYSVMSVYLPSGSSGDQRQAFKEEFMKDFQVYINNLKKTLPNLIISGDYNIVHKPIDIHNPKTNKNTSGFLPHERQWLSDFMDNGFVDSFRMHNEEPDNYTWWSYRANSRGRNKGWRIDYHLISQSLEAKCINASILSDIKHSDHCPIKIKMDF